MMRRLPLLGAVLAVLLSVAFVFLLYQPRSHEQAALEAETLTLQGEQSTLRGEIARLEQIRANQGRIQGDLDRLRQLVPDEVEQPMAVRNLQQLADAAAVEIIALTFAEPAPLNPAVPVGADQQLGSIAMTLTLDATYFEAVDFLRRVEQESERALLVRTLSMAKGEEEFPQLATVVTGEMFTLMPIAEQAPGSAPATDGAGSDASAPPPPAGNAGGSTVSLR